jgi:hypothetical protein
MSLGEVGVVGLLLLLLLLLPARFEKPTRIFTRNSVEPVLVGEPIQGDGLGKVVEEADPRGGGGQRKVVLSQILRLPPVCATNLTELMLWGLNGS